MNGRINMTVKAQKRAKLLEMVKSGLLKLTEVTEPLNIGYRQVLRIYKTYCEKGDEALNHGAIGKKSNHKISEEFKQEVISLYTQEYKSCGPTFAAEKMKEDHNIEVKPNTLRLWLLKENLWQKVRKQSKHRTRRERKHHFGEMIQMDGSIHDWFETGEKFCLMNMIDDATGTSFGYFDKGETTEVSLKALMDWISQYGIPCSIYSDRKSVFYTDKKPSIEEELAGIKPYTKFGRVCHELGIEIIYANSPQAKGRVERFNGIHQDRLIKEMKLKNIKDCETANKFLVDYYWKKNNEKFGKKAISDKNMHIPLREDQDIRNFVCYYYDRILSRDFVIRLNNRFFQITNNQDIEISYGSKVTIKVWLDKSVHIWYKGHEINYKEIVVKQENKTTA